jgi:UDP-N-acetylmuramate dehydrogenase
MSSSAVSGPTVERNVPLSSHTTIRIGGPAAYFAEPKHEAELFRLIQWAKREKLRYFVLGNGSNVIFADEGFNGLVLSLRKFKSDLIEFDHELCVVTVSSGISLSRFVRSCQEVGLAGVEFLSHIPGTVGGALVMNAGFSRHAGQRNEIGDLVEEVRAIGGDGNLQTLGRGDIKFRYRGSDLAGRIILDAKFRLWKRPKDQIQQEIKANLEHRRKKQDVHEPNAGSVFKNPEGSALTAGQLIDRAGLKGRRIGGIEISENHANYFVNKGGGTCADLQALMQEVQKTIYGSTGITLEPEVQVVPKD